MPSGKNLKKDSTSVNTYYMFEETLDEKLQTMQFSLPISTNT